jgi:hypothetical protein
MVPIQIRETMVVLPDPVGSGIRKQPSPSLGSQRLQTTSRDCRASGVGASASGFEGDSHPSVRVAFFGFLASRTRGWARSNHAVPAGEAEAASRRLARPLGKI